jgi:hypothetical protein
MYQRALIIGVIALALGAGLVHAQEADVAKTAVLSGTIKGAVSGPTAGTCAVGGYSAICPSGTCSCLTIASGKVTGRLAGTGLATVAITEDSGSATSSVSGSTCQPGFGVATLTTSLGTGKNKVVKSETINLNLSVCDAFTNSGTEAFDGGFGIAASPAPTPAASGWGTVDGTQRGTTLTLTLKGSITQ